MNIDKPPPQRPRPPFASLHDFIKQAMEKKRGGRGRGGEAAGERQAEGVSPSANETTTAVANTNANDNANENATAVDANDDNGNFNINSYHVAPTVSLTLLGTAMAASEVRHGFKEYYSKEGMLSRLDR